MSDVKAFSKVIQSVTSIMGLTALAILAAGAAFTAVLIQTPQDKQFQTFLVMVLFVSIIVFANMVYAFLMERHELTFRVRVSRLQEHIETPCEDTQIDLYKNGKCIQSSNTDEMGMLAFTVKLERKDELYVIVVDSKTGTQSNRAALYSAGQCQMIKTIRF